LVEEGAGGSDRDLGTFEEAEEPEGSGVVRVGRAAQLGGGVGLGGDACRTGQVGPRA
jgi:hypothetical protein